MLEVAVAHCEALNSVKANADQHGLNHSFPHYFHLLEGADDTHDELNKTTWHVNHLSLGFGEPPPDNTNNMYMEELPLYLPDENIPDDGPDVQFDQDIIEQGTEYAINKQDFNCKQNSKPFAAAKPNSNFSNQSQNKVRQSFSLS